VVSLYAVSARCRKPRDVGASIDQETYVRVNGTWMFSHKRSEPLPNVPFETGGAEARFP
jgi:hypothetical protein